MSPDAEKVHALLSSMLHWIPTPASLRRTSAGEVASAATTCPKCGGKGRVSRRAMPCAHCNGSGSVAVDGYTRREVTTAGRPVTHTQRTMCDSCGGAGVHGNGRRCAYCDGAGVRETAEHASDGQLARLEANQRIRDGLEAPDASAELQELKARWYAHGSYTDAEAALERLSPSLRLFVTRVVVFQEPHTLSAAAGALVAHACEQMAHLMPKPIRVPQWALEARTEASGRGRWANRHTQAQRNQRIRALHADGVPTGQIARQVGLNRSTVKRILAA